MLALAPPVQHSAVECSHISAPPSASSSTRSSRPATRRPSTYTTTNSSPSSYHTAPSTSSGHPPSPRRVHSHTNNASIPPAQFARDNEPPIPPPPNGSSSDSSPSHRGKQPEVDIHSYDPQQLLRLLASLLTQIATTNDKLGRTDPLSGNPFPSRMSSSSTAVHPPIWHSLTSASREALSSTSSLTFHARNIPSISLEAYLIRILKYCPASNEVFLSLLVYFDRMSKLAKEANGRLFVIDSYNIHRLVIAGVTVASKFFSDVFYTNSRYAKVGGLPQGELNQLELQFLLLNDFRLMISVEEMQSYAEQLIRFSENDADSSFSRSSSKYPSQPSPAGPTKYMNFVDNICQPPSSNPHHHVDSQTPQVGPTRAFRRSTSSYSTTTSDAASEAETEFDGSTDDEPTIRPGHSSASSETMSLHSTTSDSDSLYPDDGDRGWEDRDVGHPLPESSSVDYRMRSP
ncbi:cyclin-domain-containing protein [Cristinia sonorae]|uniref:Cyclin-domain-containing protein n=1 Tax=Cristinia sonorae TaxID=1940300 RepID=A0A8K0XK34_9AGAR|nr:cyclin-domain-containing protein [Cristinia sonorae]